jgi:hypothetical protein
VRWPVATLLGCWSVVSCAATRGGDGTLAAESPSAVAPPSRDATCASASPSATTPETAPATGDAMVPAFAGGDAAPPGPVATTPPAAAFAGSCFHWVHLSAFSTDCFRSRAECESERKQVAMGHRDASPCEAASRASCTVVGGEANEGHERCFGSKGDCGRFRAMLGRQGTQATDCFRALSERPSSIRRSRPARVGRVYDAFAGEAWREKRMVGDVVHVAQEHRAHTAQGLAAVHQRTRGPRRIDEDVAALADDEVAGGAVRTLRRVAALQNVAQEEVGQSADGVAHGDLARRADGARGARDQGHLRAQDRPRRSADGPRRRGRSRRIVRRLEARGSGTSRSQCTRSRRRSRH